MKVLHLSTTKDCFGIWDVCVRVNGVKEYTFPLCCEDDVDEFLRLLRFHPGKALNHLKKVKIKGS